MSYTVYKLDHKGTEQYSYEGEVLTRDAWHVCLRAVFGFPSRDLGYIHLKEGDIFTEWFYSQRWYNVFHIVDVETGRLKGYYCNITRPATIADDYVKAEDLALDVFVYPDGKTLVLDEDEYAALALGPDEHRKVKQAVAEIKRLVQERKGPFAQLSAQ